MTSTVLRRDDAVLGLPILGGAAVLAAWWAAGAAGVQPYLLPPPQAVAETIGRLPGHYLSAARVTALEVLLGFGLAAAGGITVGTLLAASRMVARALYPTLVALHATPKVALAPLLVVTLGFGIAPKVVMVVLVCAFPIVLSTTTGLGSTPAELVELARSLNASRWQTFTKLRLPHAVPQIFVGLKNAAPLAVIGAVVGELFGATAGLGFVIRHAGTDTPQVYAALVLLGGMSITLFYTLSTTERLLAPWVRHTTA